MNQLKRSLPILGIIAFSLCSTSSIYHLLFGRAKHAGMLLWLPAVLIELITAWVVTQVVENSRIITRLRGKGDRKFYTGILFAFTAVAFPLLGTSVWANWVEYGHPVLGFLFPIASIGCAIGAALPDTVSRFEKAKEKEKQEERQKRKQREAERKAKQARERALQRLGTARATFEQLIADPAQSTVEIAQQLGITRQTVGNHLEKLEQAGMIQRNGGGTVEVIFQ